MRSNRTIPTLVILIVLVPGFFLAVYAADPTFVGQKQCKICHNMKAEGEQWNKWKAMKHASALEALKSDAAKAVAAKIGLDTPPAEAAECLKCHVTSYDVATKAVHPKIKMEDSVQCESCHGPASLHLPDGKKLKFAKGDSGIDVSAHIVRPTETTCLQCHNDENPTWDPEKYTTESGEKTGFDFKQAFAQIAHLNPKKKRE